MPARPTPAAGRPKIGPKQVAKAVALAVRLGAIGRRPPAPAAESNLTGELHSKERDQAAISHHYDLSNDFYELILDPNMAYSSGFHVTPEMTLEEAQTAKLHLICRKLGLQPGMRMVDIGSGWGSLTLFAAEHYGVHVTGVTLSVEQRDYVMGKAAERGLADRVDVSLRHFRDLEASGVHDGEIDAIASIEMGEHVGDAEYVVFVDSIYRYLKPGGRALIQQMSRSNDAPATARRRPVHRDVHRPRHAHEAAGQDDRAASRRRASRSATCRRCASTTRRPSPAGPTSSRRTGTSRSS